MSTEQHTNEQKSCNSCTHKCLIALNIVLLIGLAVLYVLFFKSTSCKTDTQEATAIAQSVETTDNPTLTIGYEKLGRRWRPVRYGSMSTAEG